MVGRREKPSLLIVEDNAVNTLVLREILGEESYELLEATNGSQAVEVALSKRPDVILMDIMMPGVDGISAARTILDQFKENPPRIVAVTGNALESVRRKCLDSGFSDVLLKPVDAGALRNAVSRLLSDSDSGSTLKSPDEQADRS